MAASRLLLLLVDRSTYLVAFIRPFRLLGIPPNDVAPGAEPADVPMLHPARLGLGGLAEGLGAVPHLSALGELGESCTVVVGPSLAVLAEEEVLFVVSLTAAIADEVVDRGGVAKVASALSGTALASQWLST